jgi:hypothetical protein
MRNIFLLLALAMSLAGCGSEAAERAGWDKGFKSGYDSGYKIGYSTGREFGENIGLAKASGPVEEWGPLPGPWKRLAREAISQVLKDAGSAEFKFDVEPRMTSQKTGKITQFHWSVIVAVNAKNSFGAFTGFENWRVGFRNDAVEYARPE